MWYFVDFTAVKQWLNNVVVFISVAHYRPLYSWILVLRSCQTVAVMKMEQNNPSSCCFMKEINKWPKQTKRSSKTKCYPVLTGKKQEKIQQCLRNMSKRYSSDWNTVCLHMVHSYKCFHLGAGCPPDCWSLLDSSSLSESSDRHSSSSCSFQFTFGSCGAGSCCGVWLRFQRWISRIICTWVASVSCMLSSIARTELSELFPLLLSVRKKWTLSTACMEKNNCLLQESQKLMSEWMHNEKVID